MTKILCQSLHTYPFHDDMNRFVNIGNIPDSTHIFECGTIVNGVAEVNAYINANGTCSFINADAVTFTGLADVPHHYQDQKNKVVTVGEDENCLRFSDDIKISSVSCESVKSKHVETHSLEVKERFKVDFLEINALSQLGYTDNNLSGHTHMNKADVNELSCIQLNANTGNITGDVNIGGDVSVKSLTSKGMFNTGKALLDEVSGTSFSMDVLECECHARIKALEIGENLNVYGMTVAKDVNTHSITNTGNILSNHLESNDATFKSVVSDVLKVNTLLTKSDLVFGTTELPQLFLPNENRYIDILMRMDGLRSHGYGFSPTQCLDTIILKIQTPHRPMNADFKIGFNYYNTKDTTPSVYKLGEVLYTVDDGVIAVIKMSSNLPIAPYWVLSVDIMPY